MSNATVIKGDPCDVWEKVQALQYEPFIYIQSNGSKWRGEEPDAITTLLEMLAEYELHDWTYYTKNPCRGVRNPEWCYGSSKPQYIDGARLFETEVYHFFGNFVNYSHVFNIMTNDAETINTLIKAIDANKAR